MSKLWLLFVLLCIVLLVYAIDLYEFSIIDLENIHNRIAPIFLVLSSNESDALHAYVQETPNVTDDLDTHSHSHEHSHSHASTLTGLSQLFSNPHHIIDGNPFQFDECKNALVDRHNLNLTQFVSQHMQHLDEYTQQQLMSHLDDIVFHRELIDSLNRSLPFGHLVRIRLSYDANNPQGKTSRAREPHEPMQNYSLEARHKRNLTVPQMVYYHVSKCGSSSIHSMLNHHYNTTRLFWRSLLDVAHYGALPDIECAFSFIRHPIDRLISGYYTIVGFQRREFMHRAQQQNVDVAEIEAAYAAKHSWYSHTSNKDRFRHFVQHLIDQAYAYVSDDHLLLHVATQIGTSLGNFHAYGWPIHFLGRMEFFEDHWYALTMEDERCSNVFDAIRKNGGMHDYKLAHAMQQMGHHGLEEEEEEEEEHKSDQYVKEFKGKGLSVEQVVFIEDRDLYEQAAEYYYQDFVCFGYNRSYEAYMQHLNDKYHI